ncbi:MAG: extracellular solute-binding protein, partial [Pseudomonadota bacterium]
MLKQLSTVAGIAILAAQAAYAETITFWTPEEQPERVAIQEEMAAAFTAATGHEVEVVPVSEKDLGTRMTAAFAAGDMPDVVYHSLQYLQPWAEAGILDTGAATEVLEELGAGTFAARPLDVAAFGDGEWASVPVDGWTQMVVYRKDLFEDMGLAAPDTFDNIAMAIDKLHNGDDMFGF